jgi:hypothetical protein
VKEDSLIWRVGLRDASKLARLQDRLLLFGSLFLQILLALFFGHQYDMRIFMATGYLVGSGQNPYIAQNLTAVFNNSTFQGMTSIGYPPPWALVLGLIYRMSYALLPKLWVYNLAIKIPIIAANLCLAYLVPHLLAKMGADLAVRRRAWIILLLSPLLLYFGSAWGQFDSLVALLALLSIYFLYTGRLEISALLLALSVSFKPTSLPILPVALVFLMGGGMKKALRYFMVFFLSGLLFSVIPFIIFKWDPSIILTHWNAQFSVGGGMSYMTFLELIQGGYQLPGAWWLLGLLWVPAMAIGILALKPGDHGFIDLVKKSAGMILIFFLTRAWLSEQNVVILLPIALILNSVGELNDLALAAVWGMPLVFTIFNASPPQLLFLINPGLMDHLLTLMYQLRAIRLITRTALVIPWQIMGWWIVLACYKTSPRRVEDELLLENRLTAQGLIWWK